MTTLLKNIQAEERKRFEKEFTIPAGFGFSSQRRWCIPDHEKIQSFLDQAIQRTVEKTVEKFDLEVRRIWEQTWRDDLPASGGHNMSTERFIKRLDEVIKLFTNSPKEDK